MESLKNFVTDESLRPLLNSVRSFSVNALPDGFAANSDEMRYFSVEVVYRGEDSWAVMHRGNVYGSDLNREYEPLPSNRDDDFIRKYRFALPEAIEIAERLAETTTLRGVTVDDIREHGDWVTAYQKLNEGR